MIPRVTSALCLIALLAMSAAVARRWLDLHLPTTPPPHASPIKSLPALTSAPASPPSIPAQATPPQSSPQPANSAPASQAPSAAQQEFYLSLVRQIENLQNQNRDLIDQLAETNRELMKLEFRVDTHSSQFRPMPVTEERADTSFDDQSGILPPRPSIIEENLAPE